MISMIYRWNSYHVKSYFIFQDIMVFVEPPSKSLFCKMCNKVYKDPVMVTCGVCLDVVIHI